MKRIKTIVLAAALAGSLTACNDWLDVSATSELDRDELFKTENGYGEALTGIYANMCDASLYGRTMTFGEMDLLAGYYNGTNGVYSGTLLDWSQYAYGETANTSCDATIEAIWNGMYHQIANCNSLLETIDENQGVFSGDNYNIIKGEALGLRAFLHFDLLRMFGEAYSTGKDKECIPFVSTLSPLVTPLYTQQDLLDTLIGDLKQAKTLMENDPIHLGVEPDACLASLPQIDANYISRDSCQVFHNRRFRFNYYAATATLARIYMWMGDKANALAQAKEIIEAPHNRFPWVKQQHVADYVIGTDYNSGQDRVFAYEQVFALNMTKFNEVLDGYNYFLTVTQDNSNVEMKIDGTFKNEVYENANVDYRSKIWFDGSGSTNTLHMIKYIQPTTYEVERYFQERLPLIRKSEMYYIAAECAETKEDAIAYLNEVRNNRGFQYSTQLSTSDDVEDEILKEYRKEFWGEGQLWFYYKRKGITNFSEFMTDASLFTFEIPDIETSYGGRD